jgi:recombination protein RecA
MAKAKKDEKGLDASLERMNKKYGQGSVLALDDKNHNVYDIISSGSIALDYITLSIGGYAKGKLYELMGWEGTGKSTICGHATVECQKLGGRVAYIDGEHAVDRDYFRAIGVDTTKMLIAQPADGEQGFNIAMELIESGEVDMIIIDSDSSLIPKAVIDGDVGESSIGKKARLNNNAYPKLKGACSKYNVCVIVISQYREKIGVMFGNPTTTQGGHALKFYSDCRLEVSKTAAKDGDVVYGNITKVKSTKNKMGPPYRKSQFEIVYGKGIDKINEVMELLDEFELGRKYGKTFTYNGVKYDYDEFRKKLEDLELYDTVKADIIKAINASDIPVEIGEIEEEETEK